MEKIAVIGGLGTLSGGDLFLKLLKNKQVLKNQANYHFIFEQQPYNQMDLPLYEEKDIKSRKFYAYSICKNFENKGISKILLPCFASHSFIDELQKEIPVTILNIFEALKRYVYLKYPKGSKIGILTSDFVRQLPMLTSYLSDYDIKFPENQSELMEAIYGTKGIKNGYLDGLPLEYVYQACLDLKRQGCDVILPCITEISLIVNQLRKRGVSVIDINKVYADFALEKAKPVYQKPFKLGIVGGVGPSATVDFMNKIIQSTPAKKDQEHIKMVVEQNPQIPDRTANLIHNETDPTIALFSTCKRLEAAESDVVAIPCNTAHAYVQSIQPHLKVPIVNMLTITAKKVVQQFGENTRVGLLATTGTVQSRVYHEVLEEFGLQVVVPDTENQENVMASIYGEKGVKAGYTQGGCKEDIMKAVDYLKNQNAEVLILGCTELPLLFPEETEIKVGEKNIHLMDPTLILAQEIASMAKP